jgi:hypothetical protein
MRNAYKILVERPEGKRPLRRPRYRWVEMDLMVNMVRTFGLHASGSG